MKSDNGNNTNLPKIPLRFFRWFCKPEFVEDIEGDLIEQFNLRMSIVGKAKAKRGFIKQIVSLFRPSMIKSFSGSSNLNYIMLRENLKIGWRTLVKNKAIAVLNIGGLALGIMVTLLIGLWINNEISYDKQYQNFESIAQAMQNQDFGGEIRTWNSQAMQLAPELRANYSHYFEHIVTTAYTGNSLLSFDEKKISKSGNFMEPGITEMLSLNMIEGSRRALEDPSSILLSKTTSKDLFGDLNPIGQSMKIDHRMNVQVAGIYEDLPLNSTFGNLSFIAPWDLLKKANNYEERLGWGNSWFQVLVKLKKDVDFSDANYAIKDTKKNNIDPEDAERSKPEIFLHPMSKWNLYSKFENGKNTGGTIENVRLFGFIAFFVLLLACINFMNLSTARSEKRAKEIGIRKTLGSARNQLIGQFLVESILVVMLAFIIALALTKINLPFFNEVTLKSLVLPWGNHTFWAGSLIFIVIVGLLAGSYPAFYLSSFKPITVLKGIFKNKNNVTPRKILVTFQFVVSISLIAGTLVVLKQIKHAKNRPVGYSQNNIVSIPIKTDNIMKHFEAISQELKSTGDIVEVAASDVKITSAYTTNGGFNWQSKDPALNEEFNTLRATYDYGNLVSWEVLEGRDFSRDFKSDSLAFILNETAVEYMGFENPVGEMVEWGGNGNYRVIGVIKDMITTSPYDAVKPMIFVLHYGRFINYVNIKINPQISAQKAISTAQTIFANYDQENPFEYQFVDEAYAQKFGNEERTSQMVSFFAILAVLISCLGLLGMSNLIALQRKREIGIRKVLGAKMGNLIYILSKEFVVLILLALVIASPIAYYFLDGWLNNFTYRISMGLGIFFVAGIMTLVVTFIIVVINALKVALLNPTKTLRSE